MSAWIVYSKDGTTERCRLKKLEYSGSFMNERTVTATFECESEVAFDVFDYIEYRGEKFELEAIPSVKKTSSHNYEYELRFVSLKYELERCEMRDIVPNDNGIVYPTPLTFSFTGDVAYLAERIQANLDALYGKGVWSIVVAEGVTSEDKNITISQQNCWNALSLVNTTYELDFTVKGRVVTIGGNKPSISHVFQYGKGKGLYEIERSADTETGIVTKLRAYGGTKNLDYSYPKKPEWSDSILDTSFVLSPLRLMLPSFKKDGKTDYIMADDSLVAKYGIREASVIYEDIYPSITGATNSKGEAIDEIKAVDDIDDSKSTFVIHLYELGFDLEDNLTTANAQVSMKTGAMQGYTFNIADNGIERLDDGSYKLTLGRITASSSDTDNFDIPNSKWNMKAGDKFVFLNILMPQEYIRSAENRLLERAKEYLAEYGKTNFSYNVGLHDKFLKQNQSVYNELIEGSKLSVYDEELGISENVTIQSISITENMEDNILPQVKVTLNNKPSASTLDRIQGQIKELSENASNSFSSQSELLQQYKKKLDKPFFDRLFVAVGTNGKELASTDTTSPIAYIKAKYSFVTVGGVTMYAQDGSVDIPSIAEGLPFDGRTIWFNPETNQIEVIGGTGGGEGVSNFWDLSGIPSWITNTKPTYSYTEIQGTPDLSKYALASDIPSLSGYATEQWVLGRGYALSSDLSALTTKVNDFLEGSDTDNIINKWKELESFLEGLSETDNLATILGTKADKTYVDSTFVTIAGTEDVTGVHNFVNGLMIGGMKLFKSQDDVVYLDGNLVVRGGVTMYALDDATVDSIIDKLPIASTTTKGIASFDVSYFTVDANGKVSIIPDSVGLNEVELDAYLTRYKYATHDWVTSQGYLKEHQTIHSLTIKRNGIELGVYTPNSSAKDVDIIVPTKVSDLDNDSKFINGITSTMVTGALGYTPYNAASFTNANIKSTLGISDWALETSKPSYKTSEVTEDTNLYFTDERAVSALSVVTKALQDDINLKWTQNDEKILNWDTAFSWGNHALAGYALRTYVDDTFVTINGDEDVEGVHNFINGLKIGGILVNKSKEDVIYIDANLVVKGGITMYGDENADIPSIYDGLPIDGVTIYWDTTSGSKVLKAKFTDGALTEIDSQMIISALGYTPYNGESNPKGFLTDHQSLVGYATETWVNQQGFLTEHQDLSGYQTKITATNKLAYSLISGTPDLSVYAKTTDVDDRIDALINGAPSAYDTLKEIADVLAGNVDSIGDIITTLGTKADKAIEISAGVGLSGGGTLGADRTLSLATSGVTAGTYKNVTVDKYGRVTSGTNPTTLAGYGITDAKIDNGVITLGDNTITPLTSHQTIYKLTFQSGIFSASEFTANASNKTVNIPTTTSHISEGTNLYFTNARAVSALADTLKAYVTLSGTQTITGEKNFTGGLKVNGSPIVYDATNKYWKLEGDLIVTGGVTMYGSDSEFNPSTIMDGVIVDNVTIKKNSSGALYFAGSVDGGVASSVDWSNITSKPAFATVATSGKYSDLTGLPTIPTSLKNPYALTFGSKTYDGSAARTIVASDLGALTAHQTIYNLTIKNSAGTTQLTYTPNSGAGSITLTKAMVGLANVENTALSTWVGTSKITTLGTITTGTWNGTKIANTYLANSAITISGTAVSLGGSITQSALRTALGLGSNAYSSTAFLPLTGGTLTSTGAGLTINHTSVNGTSAIKFQTKGVDTGNIGVSVDNVPQFYHSALGKWYNIWHSGNDGSGSGLDADLLDGFQQTDFFKGRGWKNTNLDDFDNGIAMTAVKDNAAINSPYGYANVVTFTNGQTDYGSVQFVGSKNMLYYRTLWDNAWGDWETVAFTDSNVASATKLQTARTIWGQSFDGTGNVSGHVYLQNSHGIRVYDTSGKNHYALVLDSANNMLFGNGTSAQGYPTVIYGNHITLRYGTSQTIGMLLNSSGNITIGSSDLASTNYKLYVNGTSYFSNQMTTVGNFYKYNAAKTYRLSFVNDSDYCSIYNIKADGSAYGNLVFQGNVGVGTTTPAYKLTVAGTANFEGSTYIGTTSSALLGFMRGSANYITTPSNGYLIFNMGGTTTSAAYSCLELYEKNIIMVRSGGNVGIGTASPTQKLHIAGNVYATGYINPNYITLESTNSKSVNSGGFRMGRFDEPLGGIKLQFGGDGTGNFSIINRAWNAAALTLNNSGNLSVSGGITMYSDQRKKTILNHVELSLQQVANAPLIEHYYNSDQNKTTHVGSIAQYWAEMNDWFCKKDSEGFYTMEIQNAALASAISVARELVKFETETDRRIRLLEEENKRLKEEVEQLKWNIA